MPSIETSSHIGLDERGVAWIDRTGVKVIEVAVDWLANRSSAEEMHLQYPHLSVAQIHAALAYYHDHKEPFDRAIAESLGRKPRANGQAGRRKLRLSRAPQTSGDGSDFLSLQLYTDVHVRRAITVALRIRDVVDDLAGGSAS